MRRRTANLHHSRLWPSGIAGRLIGLLILCLCAVQIVTWLFYAHNRAQYSLSRFTLAQAERIVATVELLEATPTELHNPILRALNSPTLQVSLTTGQSHHQDGGWPHSEEIKQTLRQGLRGLGDRVGVIGILSPWGDVEQNGQRVFPTRRGIVVPVRWTDDLWLEFVISLDSVTPGWRIRLVGQFVFVVLLILVIGGWAAHRLTRPLTRFAAAADRLGVDVHAPPLPERGARELRQAARAFNRMQDRLRRLIDDRTQMLAAISHDLRTALTRLQLRTEFIDDQQQRQKALSDLEEMHAMLSATLSFARDDMAAEARSPLDLAVLLQTVCDDWMDAGQSVAYQGPDHLTWVGRPTALRRAFANLIDNAVKYGQQATVTLTEADGALSVTIGDRGPGIPAALRGQVFTPFFRLETSRNRETGGVGLGLAVARTAIRRHGGDMALTDRPGGGLLVTITLPRVAGDTERAG
ncbi:MAG: ATP-binding protein [Candidatus Competibacteraceae bacterium]|jgi:signal transduction histidine kinase|nr:ATP-binding protein [Candidatus Competibacteraceae bacterium]